MRIVGKTAVLASLLSALAAATTVVPLPVEKIAAVSTQVIEGTAGESWSQWNPQHTLIYTYTRFHVSRTLKGSAARTVVVRQLGGSAEGYTQHVAGVRYWRQGEQSVLFLHPSEGNDGTLSVTGLMQGNFAVYHTPTGATMVSNGMPGVSAYHPSTNAVSTYQGNVMRLEELVSRVQKAGLR